MEVQDNILLIVGFPQGILLQQLGHHPIRLLNIIITLISNNNLLIIKWYEKRPSHLKVETGPHGKKNQQQLNVDYNFDH